MDYKLHNLTMILAVFAVGLALGGYYCIALWQTVQRLPTARNPFGLMIGSFVLRMAVVLTGFYFIMRGGHFELFAAALLGFALMKTILTRRLGIDRAGPRKTATIRHG
jgi:F1F0 ATPase subunit 2